jgi:hypothetical protein
VITTILSEYHLRICHNNEWRLPPEINCTTDHCPLVEAILDYARDNLVMFNIFIKVSSHFT